MKIISIILSMAFASGVCAYESELDLNVERVKIAVKKCILEKDYVLQVLDQDERQFEKIVKRSFLQESFKKQLNSQDLNSLSSFLRASCALSDDYRQNIAQIYKATQKK